MNDMTQDPRNYGHIDSFPSQSQEQPGLTQKTIPEPDHGEETYVGSNKLKNFKALITGGDSGIGRAVAIAFSREGADVAFTYLMEEQEDAQKTREWVEKAGRRCVPIATDLREETNCTEAVEKAVSSLDGLDILILNAGYQKERKGIEKHFNCRAGSGLQDQSLCPHMAYSCSRPLPACRKQHNNYHFSPGLFTYA